MCVDVMSPTTCNFEVGVAVPIPILCELPCANNVLLPPALTWKSTSPPSPTITWSCPPSDNCSNCSFPAVNVITSAVYTIFVSVSPLWKILCPTVISPAAVISSVDVICSAVIVPLELISPLAVMFPKVSINLQY